MTSIRDLFAARWLYEDAHYLAVDVTFDRDAVRRWVPWPLRLPRVATGTLFTAWFPRTAFGSVYREAGLLVDVARGLAGRRHAVFSPWMIVDDDVALVAGRELLGYPKKIGAIEFDITGDRIEATASRRGTSLVRMSGTLGPVLASPPPMLGRPHRNVRASLGIAAPKLVAFTPEEHVREARVATLAVEVGGSARDPLDTLGMVPGAARLYRVDLGARTLGAIPRPVAPVSPSWLVRQLFVRVH